MDDQHLSGLRWDYASRTYDCRRNGVGGRVLGRAEGLIDMTDRSARAPRDPRNRLLPQPQRGSARADDLAHQLSALARQLDQPDPLGQP